MSSAKPTDDTDAHADLKSSQPMKYAAMLLCLILVWAGCLLPQNAPRLPEEAFDWQGHRGARGLLPENTIPAFIKALELGMTTLELDLAVSADSQLVVSHEPWLSPQICRKADGTPLEGPHARWNIFAMPAAALDSFDCGSHGHPAFPTQQPYPATKPLFDSVVFAVRQWCAARHRPLPWFNVEIKSRPEWDDRFTPQPETFVRLVLQAIDRLELHGHLNIQSFDLRVLRHAHALAPELPLALLIDTGGSVQQQVDALGFTPAIYSPYYKLVTAQTVRACRRLGMKLIPWTVNEPEEMCALIRLGVDGIITDFPDRAAALRCSP